MVVVLLPSPSCKRGRGAWTVRRGSSAQGSRRAGRSDSPRPRKRGSTVVGPAAPGMAGWRCFSRLNEVHMRPAGRPAHNLADSPPLPAAHTPASG
eukprot:scaffold12248_cov110-Isochrysis_galbana.AAC.1